MTTLPNCYRCGQQPCECRDGITLYNADCRKVAPLLIRTTRPANDQRQGVMTCLR